MATRRLLLIAGCVLATLWFGIFPGAQNPAKGSEVKLSFWGGTDTVAGACYLLSVVESRVLIDCGSFMSSTAEDAPIAGHAKRSDEDSFPFDPALIDALLVTHAHADHTGRILYLVARGFGGPIYMTDVTAELILARLGDDMADCKLSSSEQTGLKDRIASQIVRVSYGQPKSIVPGLRCTFVDAGHLPGSASIVIEINTAGLSKTITFSGDIGSGQHPFLNPPDLVSLAQSGTETLVIESTYGYRPPRDSTQITYEPFWKEIRSALDAGKRVIIPAFALDRTQRVLGAIADGVATGAIRPGVKILVAGKSSCYFTRLYQAFQLAQARYAPYFSDRFWIEQPMNMKGVTLEYSRDAACAGPDDDPMTYPGSYTGYDVIIAPSGSGSSAVARELLRAFIDDPNVVVFKVGWVDPDSPLGQMSGGATTVSFGIDASVDVRAKLADVSASFSGHADTAMLLGYIGAFPQLKNVIIVHGDDLLGGRLGLETSISERFPDLPVVRPSYGDVIDPFSLEKGLCYGEACLRAEEARTHVGTSSWVCGAVASVTRLTNGRTFLNLVRSHPTQAFTIMIDPSAIAKFDSVFGHGFQGKLLGTSVCAYGRITLYEGSPQIVLSDPGLLWSSILRTPVPERCRCSE